MTVCLWDEETAHGLIKNIYKQTYRIDDQEWMWVYNALWQSKRWHKIKSVMFSDNSLYAAEFSPSLLDYTFFPELC